METPNPHETRISLQLAAYDNDGTLKMLLDIVTILAQQVLAWIDEPHRHQVHAAVGHIVVLLPLLIELVSQSIVVALLLIEILSLALNIIELLKSATNTFLNWCEDCWEDYQFMRTGQIGVYA